MSEQDGPEPPPSPASIVGTRNTSQNQTLFHVKCACASRESRTVLRSLTDFKALHAALGRQCAERALPPLPWFSLATGSTLTRMEALNVYLLGACRSCNASTVGTLLIHGADPGVAVEDGGSPLEAALEAGHIACAHTLAAAGGEITVRAEQLALSAQVEPGRLLASLRAAQWQATKGVGLLGSPCSPQAPYARGSGGGNAPIFASASATKRLEARARRLAEDHQRAARAWRATLDAAPLPPGMVALAALMISHGPEHGLTQKAEERQLEVLVAAELARRRRLSASASARSRSPEKALANDGKRAGDGKGDGIAHAVDGEVAESARGDRSLKGSERADDTDGEAEAADPATAAEEAADAADAAAAEAARLPSVAELRALCERGIPPDERWRAWPLLLSMRAPLLPIPSEFSALRQAAAEQMSAAVARLEVYSVRACDGDPDDGGGERGGKEAEEEQRLRLILTDLGRTFPSLGLFCEGGSLRSALQELLWVYCSAVDGGLPYVQGMSHVAAVLLLAVQDAALACASLSALLSGYPIFRACVSLQVQPAVRFFDLALGAQLPALASRLSELGIPSDLFLVPWLVTLFARSLPLPIACRIWDRVLSEGEAELFRAALALLSCLQPVLLVASFEEAVHLLHHLPFPSPADDEASTAATYRLAEATLLAAMDKVVLPVADFERLHAQCVTERFEARGADGGAEPLPPAHSVTEEVAETEPPAMPTEGQSAAIAVLFPTVAQHAARPS